jgi:hypothetical protein
MNTDGTLLRLTKRLYAKMPGAPQPPSDEVGVKLWGEVQGNDHWQFCEEIIQVMSEFTLQY